MKIFLSIPINNISRRGNFGLYRFGEKINRLFACLCLLHRVEFRLQCLLLQVSEHPVFHILVITTKFNYQTVEGVNGAFLVSPGSCKKIPTNASSTKTILNTRCWFQLMFCNTPPQEQGT